MGDSERVTDTLSGRLMRPKTMQQHNAYVVLELVKKRGPLSRAEIARTLGFSKSAVSEICALLLGYDLMRRSGKGNPRTGRKSELLEFNPGGRYFVGVDLSWERKVFAIVDLAGRIVASERADLPTSEPQGLVDGIALHAARLIEGSRVARELIGGVGIMVPGLVDSKSGRVIYSRSVTPALSVSEEISTRLALPVAVENDANALALGEDWVGHGKDYSKLAYLYLGDGVGGAFISRGALLEGADNASSEFGKMVVDGGSGAVQAEHVLLRRFSELKTMLGLVDATDSEIREAIATAAGEPRIAPVLKAMLHILAQMVANIVAVLNPEVIILNGPFIPPDSILTERLRTEAERFLPEQPRRTLRLLPASLDEETGVIGGAAVAMYRSAFQFIVTGGMGAQMGESTERVSVENTR